jgi:hypothetical protein
MDISSRTKLCYRLVLPTCVVVNLGLGVTLLGIMHPPRSWLEWVELASGVLCCAIAGGVASALVSRRYWGAAISRQVAAWRRIADAVFGWLEEAPVPADAIRGLQRSVEEASAHDR